MTDAEIETVARGICTALGLDPDEQSGGGPFDGDTPAERKARFVDGVMREPAVYCFMPRWRRYRWKAAEALAVQAALASGKERP
jgi:hypothetical protein